MQKSARTAVLAAGLCVLLAGVAPGQSTKEFKYNVSADSNLNVTNPFGAVVIKPATGHQIVISATAKSNKVEVDAAQVENRVEVRSHMLQQASAADCTVDYEILAPADANVTVRAGTGPIRVERLAGDLTLNGEAASIDVSQVQNAHVHVRAVGGPVTLSNITGGHVEVTALGGGVTLTNVSGPKVYVSSTKGTIRYDGDPSGGGEYQLINGTGNIEVTLPASASVDLTARSATGSVDNQFPMVAKQHTAFDSSPRSFAGMSASGSSSVHLSSLSGTIRVRKR
ncbi:MAG TPA: DUF4097 family beta strand repeat-containing protein [Terriglobales bacterium]|nr:DUF4097 family beta strand repeat-containing protein [Terriglobales bacterium]